MRPYNLKDAQLKGLLVSIDSSLGTLAVIEWTEHEKSNTIAVISDSIFLLVSKRLGRILCRIPLQDIVSVCGHGTQAVSQEGCKAWVNNLPVSEQIHQDMRLELANMMFR